MIDGPGYHIVVVVGDQAIDPECDAVDVTVELDGEGRYAAVFGTTQWIAERFKYYRVSGECAGGLYFWTSDLIIVERLTLEVIQRTVEDLIRTQTLQLAFSGPSFDIPPLEDANSD